MEPGGFYVAARFWFSVVAFIVSGAAAVYAYLANRARSRSEDAEDRIDVLEERMTKVESIQEHAPTHRDLGEIYDKLSDTNQALSRLTGKLDGLVTSLARIESYLLNRHGGDG